jgi:hypothetical protein
MGGLTALPFCLPLFSYSYPLFQPTLAVRLQHAAVRLEILGYHQIAKLVGVVLLADDSGLGRRKRRI